MTTGVRTASGDSVYNGFSPQFPSASVSNLSMAVVLIEQLSNDGFDTTIGHGTGFIKYVAGRYFLVTARHVLSGRDPFSSKLLSREGYLPRRFRIHPTVEYPSGSNFWTRSETIIESSDEEQPIWVGDPDFETLRTDIAVWPLSLPPGMTLRHVGDTTSREASMMVHPGLECMVIGFPLGSGSRMQQPVWRRGVMASEPMIPWDNKPIFLLDCTTSPGFSGSPVFRHHVGPLPLYQNDGSITMDPLAVITTSLIGVYGGRLQHSHFGGEVPYVFYGNRIPIIIAAAQGG